MAEPTRGYDLQSTYQKFNGNCPDSTEKPKGCGCCPEGLVAIYENCGKHSACLSPNDAELYNNSQRLCAEGYIKLFHPVTQSYLGCVSEADYITIITALTPAV